MEEEGEEDDVKKRRKPPLKPKPKIQHVINDKTPTPLSKGDNSANTTKLPVSTNNPLTSSKKDKTSSSESEEEESDDNKNLPQYKQMKPDKDSSEASESGTSEEESVSEEPQDNGSKVAKSVSFSPITECLVDKAKETVNDSEEEVSSGELIEEKFTTEETEKVNLSKTKNHNDKIKHEEAEEKQDIESKEEISNDHKVSDSYAEEDSNTLKEGDEKQEQQPTDNSIPSSSKKPDDESLVENVAIDVSSDNLVDGVKDSLLIDSETNQKEQSDPKTKVDSPNLPPRNANGTSPPAPPKPDPTSKKSLAAPLMSAMKKMVEAPMNFIKSKKDSKSPTRKDKIEIGPPILISKNELDISMNKTKDNTSSPPLPPRNKTNPESPSLLLKNNDGSTESPVLSFKIKNITDSPKLPPRNRIETAFISSPKAEHIVEKELENLPLKNYISDDPKRFCSLQIKRNNGNGRVRESSLPPPSRKDEFSDGRKSPKVPPKTWMWEEVRRSRIKGGYPWTHLYKGSLDEAKWKEIMEHEYEYVDPRPELLRPEPVRPQVAVRVTPSPEPEKPKQQRRFIRIKDTDQVIIPLHGSSDEEHNPDRYDDPDLIGQEEIGLTPPAFRPSPSPSPSRRKDPPEPKLSEKLRTTAGHIGSKIRKISIPDKSKIRLPEKPKFISDIQHMKLPDKPKFLTEKPKFLTEKPKFLTEKPKFLTEKPKFLTEKPKFLTEKPKFLTEKPKFLTEKPKFLTEKPKFLTEKPKFLTEKPKFLTEKPKFLREGIKLPERPKINMPTISLPKPRRQKKRETSVKSEYGSEKNLFQTLKARTYPRFLNKKKKQGTKKASPPPNAQQRFDSESLPSTPASKRKGKWTEVYKQKAVDDEGKVASYANGESFHERYSKREAKRASSSSIVDSDREQASSGSSTQRHRAGVIEEIDSDEFFVRVKGISREDVQVSRYLSSEIREAFCSPKNALASLDKEDFDDEEPLPPHRSKKPKEYPRKEFNTFPLRPSRSKKEKGTMEKPPRRFRSKNKPGSLPSLDRDREFDMDIEEALPMSSEPPLPPKRRKSAKDLATEEHWITTEIKVVPDEGMALDEMKVEYDIPPVAPVRKTRSRGTSLADEDRTSRGAESIKSEMQMEDELLNDDLHMEDELRNKEVREVVEMAPTFALNESSIPMEKSVVQESPAYSNVSKSRPPRPPLPPQKENGKGKTLPHHRLKSKLMANRHMQQLQSWKNQGVHFFFTYPRKAMNSISRTPKRPVRNYSTIAGPTRPPRRRKGFREPVYVDADIDPTESIPFIDEDDKLKTSRSEEAIGGMKGRPLPPPPRPPSPTKDMEFIDNEPVNIEKVNVLNNLAGKESAGESISLDTAEKSIKLDDSTDKMQSRPLPPPPRKKRGSTSTERKRESVSEEANVLNDLDNQEAIDARMTIDILEPISVVSVHQYEPEKVEDAMAKTESLVRPTEETPRKVTAEISQQTSMEVAEITVSVQTDPLPEGAIVEDSEETTSSTKPHESDEEPTIEKYLEKYGSEIKMLGRHVAPTKPSVSPEISKPQPPKSTPESKKEAEIIEKIEKEIIPSNLASAESEKNINKSEIKVKEKIMPIVKEEPKKEEKLTKEKAETKPLDVPVSLPDRLHLSHLDVDNLNVNSLKASQILVSDLSGQSIQVAELTSRGGNLVVSGMEFPPNFIQSLASEISTKVEEKIPQKIVEIPKIVEVVRQQEEKPAESLPAPHRPQKLTVVTAPPTVIVQPTAESFTLTPEAGKLSTSDNIPTPRTTRNKGKKSSESSRIVDDSEDELATSMEQSSRPSPSRASPVKQTAPSPPQPPSLPLQTTGASGLTARQLLVELLKIWKDCVSEGFSACSNTVGAMFPEGNKRRDAQTAACVLFVIIIGLFALGFGTDNTVHYHHWDYMPPRV